jgi:hypothetical protein
MFRDTLSVPASRVEKFKRENRAQGKLTDTIFSFGTSSSNFLKMHIVSEASFCFFFQAKKHLIWLAP